MLLTITTARPSARDLGHLLHKHPDRFQTFDLTFGRAHVFYPEASDESCSACLLLEIDSVELARGGGGFNADYVSDRPYVASSFLSVALARVFRSAMRGDCPERPELASTPIPLEARIESLPARGGEEFLRKVFGPLGYEVDVRRHPLDDRFPEWGDGAYHSVTIRKTGILAELLSHLYVLIPVFDKSKHYYVGRDEIEKLLDKGAGWLSGHPFKEEIAKRYLKNRAYLYREAIARLSEESAEPDEDEDEGRPAGEEILEKPLSLNEQRLGAAVAALKVSGAKRVLDLGCGEGKLIRELMKFRQFEEIVGVDVSHRTLEVAAERLRLERLPESDSNRVKLIHGSLTYRDRRLNGFEAAAVIEVIEHLDPPRLSAFERVLFEFARPETVVLTTPNREYNVVWETLPAGKFRHSDHRFEWTRDEFQAWAKRVSETFGYSPTFLPIGPLDPRLGSPTQAAIFRRG